MKKLLITKEQLGKEYPFTVSPVTIKKDRIGGLYVVYGKQIHNLNGVSKKGIKLDSIWLENPYVRGFKKTLSPIFDICRENGFM